MRRVNRSLTHTPALYSDIRAGIADGNPLDADTRRKLERSFDLDLSAIRVHAGRRADRLARTLRADAFATGSHLFFSCRGLSAADRARALAAGA